jgi:transposase-like protein
METAIVTTARNTTISARTAGRRRRHSSRERALLLARFESSGGTAAEFCRRNGVHPATFSCWRKSAGCRSAFAEVRVSEGALPKAGALQVTIHVPGELCVEVPAGIDPRWIAEVIAGLRAGG